MLRFLVLCVAAVLLNAEVAKRPLTHNDYAAWRSITGQRLSPDGKYVAYFLFPQEGDGEVVVRELATGKERRESAGALPQAPVQRNEPTEPGAEERPGTVTRTLLFSADSRTLFFTAHPTKAEIDKARKDKKDAPKNGLVIMSLVNSGDGSVVRIPRVKAVQVPEDGSGYVAYELEAAVAAKPESKPDEEQKDQARTGARSATRGRSDTGSELVLRSLSDGTERHMTDVVEFSLSRDARTLIYAVGAKQQDANGVFVVATGATAEAASILKGKGKYSKLSWDENQTKLAFISDRDDASAKRPKFKLYGWTRNAATADEWVSSATPGFRHGFVPSDKGAISFSKDGSRVFFGCVPAAGAEKEPEKEAEAPATDDKPVFDLWHWKDDFIQPMQKIRATQERARSYRAVYRISEKKVVQLADQSMQDAVPDESGAWALGADDREYRRMVEYDARFADQYLVDAATGERKTLLNKVRGTLTWSPDGRFVLFFQDRHWRTISVPDGKQTILTGKLSESFATEQWDVPQSSPAYGIAGWSKDGKSVLLYDNFDIWQFAPDGSAAKNLTAGLGRRNRLQFRLVRMNEDNPRQRYLDLTKPLLLRAEHIDTHDSGFYRVSDNAEPRKLIMGARKYSVPVKARNADVFLVTASTFSEYPDLLITDSTFGKFQKVSDANPQRAQFSWGSGELLGYKNLDGVELTAALYKPENLDPKKKYPLMVYIYERFSQNVYNFVDPRPSQNINTSYYVSNGYLVLMPDITYTVGYPGHSALKCVLPAIQALVDRGIVDEKAIGIQGHSWGGYQIAYLVTQTGRFRAAAAGAPVSNMISAYDGIRWGSGTPRQFQYERGQSRIGGSPWQYPSRFVENSPIFMADRVQTPLMILHNDGDDAVPWYQGIEYYLALRRLGKEVYLFDYNGEPHGLRKRANQKDYTTRMQQFFDYHLKGAPAPDWMIKGLPQTATLR